MQTFSERINTNQTSITSDHVDIPSAQELVGFFASKKKKKKKPVMEDICHTCGIDFQSPADLAYDTLVVTMIVIMA